MYVRYIVMLSRNHCCNVTRRSIFIVVGVDVAINHIKLFGVHTGMQQWVPFALMLG
jgi:hypothetical protein